MKLEEMQELADAIETVNAYSKTFPMRAINLLNRAVGWIIIGFLVQFGMFVFDQVAK